MRRSYFILAAALTAVPALTGCNTYFQNSYQKIVVRTPGIENADCTLTTKTNKYYSMTPRAVVVERSLNPLTIVCEKTGYEPASVVVKSHVYAAPATLNFFNGIVPGTAYDVASNSIYEYPELIVINLQPSPDKAEALESAYTLKKRPEPVKPAPPATAPQDKAAADKTISKSSRK